MGMSWNGEIYSPPEFSIKEATCPLLKKTKCKITTQRKLNAAQLQMFATLYMHIFATALTMCTMQRGTTSTHIHRGKKGDVLTEKHPVLLGVWLAALLSGEAHACSCCVSSQIAGSGAHTSCCCCCCWQTDQQAGRRWEWAVGRLCLSRGIETRQPFACDTGGWSVCECPADTPYCPIVTTLKAPGANTLPREADICSD